METYFTADLHFGHERIIELCDRPFDSLAEMESQLIANWNEVVDDKDDVYILGDFSFKGGSAAVAIIMSRLKGKKHLIIGNHEKDALGGNNCYLFDEIEHYKELHFKKGYHGFTEDIHLILSHYPMISWNRKLYGSIQLFGHEHGSLNDKDVLHHMQLDVGVDSHDFYPISLEQVLQIITKQYVKAGI